MKQSYDILLETNMIMKITKQEKYGLQSLIQGENEYSTVNWSTMKTNREKAKEHILNLYHLTTEILAKLNLIQQVNYTVTYFDKNGKYYRLGNFELTTENVNLQGESSGSLNISRSAIKKAALKAASEQKDAYEKLNNHYQNFIEPYVNYSKNNNTGWRINRGVAAEAFERHWEQLNHSMENPDQMIIGDYGSEGRRWVLYRQSSGSAAYYTGPDTALSQVKNYNATVIHNIDTVLNATDFIFKLFEGKINIQESKEQILKALSQKDTMTFSKKIWDNLSQTARDEVAMELFGTKNYVQKNYDKNHIYLEQLDMKFD